MRIGHRSSQMIQEDGCRPKPPIWKYLWYKDKKKRQKSMAFLVEKIVIEYNQNSKKPPCVDVFFKSNIPFRQIESVVVPLGLDEMFAHYSIKQNY